MSATGTGLIKLVCGIGVGLVIVGFVLGIGMRINYENVEDLEAQDLGVQGNQTRDELVGNLYSGFQLMSLSPYLIAAMGVIVIIFSFLALTGRV